uniref:leucine-rich repeat domain-containing protein n=1 Tax=Flavobacterium sp. TaxID=239 RepID=UPI004047EBF7
MKKIILFFAIAIHAFSFSQNVNIPDANFKNALLQHGVTITGVGISKIDANNDGEIQITEAGAYTGRIDCSNLSISDLTGIEAFTALTKLYCDFNQLTSLNVSQNTALIDLRCFNNQLTSLDVSQNTSLTQLHCSSNQLASLNLGLNTTLNELICFNNQLTSLDVSQNTSLTQLHCYTNQLTSLDVSQNTSLIRFNCSENQLTSLDVSQSTVLTMLYCNDNQLTSLDVSQSTTLTSLYCYNNQLTSLNVANGNNQNITNQNFRAHNNPNLTCIQVDDVAYSGANWTYKDIMASYSANCSQQCIVNIPDSNFKAYLVGNVYILRKTKSMNCYCKK